MPDPKDNITEEDQDNFADDSEETLDTLDSDDGPEDDVNPDEQTQDEENTEEDDEADGEREDGDDDLEVKYLEEHRLPGNPKSIDDVITSYKELLRKTNELMRNQSDTTTGVEPLQKETQNQRQPFFKTNLTSQTVESMVKSGDMDVDAAKTWRGVAKVVDEAMNPFITQIEGVLNTLATTTTEFMGEFRESSWRRFQHKDLATREELDSILKRSGGFDYNKAFKHMLIADEALVSKFAAKQQKTGENKGSKNKKLPRFTSNRRSKPTGSQASIGLKRFLNPDKTINESEIGKLPTDKRLKVLELYEKTYLNG